MSESNPTKSIPDTPQLCSSSITSVPIPMLTEVPCREGESSCSIVR